MKIYVPIETHSISLRVTLQVSISKPGSKDMNN